VRRARRILPWLAGLGLAVGLVTLPASSAQAASIPPLKWPAVAMTGMPQATRTLTQSDGGVTVGCSTTGDSGTTTAFESFNPSGGVTQNVLVAGVDPQPIGMCFNTSAVGQDGTVFTAAYDTGQSRVKLTAYLGGVRKWVYTPACLEIGSLTVGTNGNVYMIGSGTGCGTPRLIGVKPTLTSSQTSPTVVTSVQISRNIVYSGALSAYSGGLIVRFYDGIGFYSYTGVRSTSAPGWTLPLAGYNDTESFATADTGRAFIPIAPDQNTITACSGDSSVVPKVSAYQVGGFQWDAPLPACSRVYTIRPTRYGTAIALVETPQGGVPGGQYDAGLYVLSSGQANLLTSLPSPIVSIGVDGNNNVVVYRQFKRTDPANGRDYAVVSVEVFSGYTGAKFGAYEFSGGASDGYGFAAPAGFSNIPAMANGRVYVTLAHCNYDLCDTSTTTLYAVTVPGVGIDYPRGAVLNYTAAGKSYVAMGDSFSAGEGVPAFDPATDTAGPPENRCHRSNSAYSKLLNGNTNLRWNLTAFVACSGATTSDVINGKWSEPPQVNALSSSTQVVTITIGGNDVEFEAFAKQCIGWPNYDPLAVCDAGSSEYQTTMSKLDNVLPGNLARTTAGTEGVLVRIRRAAPNARIYVIGYPQLAPPSTEPHQWPWCSWINSESEHTAARDVVTRLNLRLQQAVSLMDASFSFIDPNAASSPFAGHELCDSESYFNGPQVPAAYSLHPNSKGQDAYRQLVVSRV
jgi:lysophospholipase L1-like esterase